MLSYFNRDPKSKIFLIFLGNYFTASIFSFVSLKPSTANFGLFEILLGSFGGFLFLTNFIIYRTNIKINGLSLSVSAMRVSLIIPTIISILIFNESIALINYIGIGVIIFSFMFAVDTKNFHNIFWILFLFTLTGLTDSLLKIYDEIGNQSNDSFIFMIFSSAFFFTLIVVLSRKTKFQLRSILYGLSLGIPNQLTTKFFMKGLETVKAAISYPFFASAIVLFSIISDIFIWKKKFNLKERLAFAFIIIGIVFLNISNHW